MMWTDEARAAAAAARAGKSGGAAHQHGVRAALGPHPEMLTKLGRQAMRSQGREQQPDRTDRMYYGGGAGAAKSYGTGVAGFY